MKKVTIILSIIFVIIIGLVFLVNRLNADVEDILDETIQEIDLSNIEDGTYEGAYNEAIAVNVTLLVTVQNNEITEIEILEHQNGKGKPAEAITVDIINNQSILIDDISGATYSSRVIKLAVQNAVKGGLA